MNALTLIQQIKKTKFVLNALIIVKFVNLLFYALNGKFIYLFNIKVTQIIIIIIFNALINVLF